MTTAKTQAEHALAVALELAALGWKLTPVTLRRNAKSGKKDATFHARVRLEDGKTVGWRHEAGWSSDRDQILAWFADHPETSFAIGGAANGMEAVDLDVDEAKGVDAPTWWNDQGLPGSPYVQSTPSGGLHIIWRADYDGRTLPQEAGKSFGKGVDTRNRSGLLFAAGGYVVGEDGCYGALADLVAPGDLPTTPAVVLDMFEQAAQRERVARPSDGQIRLHDEAWQKLQVGIALSNIAGHDRDAGGYRAKLQHAGLFYGRVIEQRLTDRRTAIEMILDAHRAVWGPTLWPENLKTIEDALDDGPRLERWRTPAGTSELRAGTGMTGAEVNEAAARTSALATSPTINVDLANEPSPELISNIAGQSVVQEWLSTERDGIGPDAEAALIASLVVQAERRALVTKLVAARARPARPSVEDELVWDDDLESIPLPAMAIGELLPENAVGFLGGPSGAYKSFVAVSLALSLAYGVPGLGHHEFTVRRPRKVLYLAAEDSSGVALRIRAAKQRLGLLKARQLVVHKSPVQLTDESHAGELLARMVAHGIEHIIVDTFRQTTIGLNENDNPEVSQVLGTLIRWRDEFGIGSTLLDHTNKTAGELADLGGAGAKRANSDYVLMTDLPGQTRDRDQQRTLRVAKLKNRPDGRRWAIRLDTVHEVVDEGGYPSATIEVGEVVATEWGATDIGELWRTADIPEDVREYRSTQGKGTGSLAIVAQMMRTYTAGSATGMTRAEVLAAVLKLDTQRSKNTVSRSVARGWDALIELKRIQTVSPSGVNTGASRWLPKEGEPEHE